MLIILFFLRVVRSDTYHFFNCESPKLVFNRYNREYIQVPCGKCHACKVRKANKWVAPLVQESSCHKYTFFCTLTYSDSFLPKINLIEYEKTIEKKDLRSYENCKNLSRDYIAFCRYQLPVCSTQDVQRFLKRLRENIFREFGIRGAVRYFISWDYGSTTFRPHYHCIFFVDDSRLASEFREVLVRSWSVYRQGRYVPIGNIDCQYARSAAKYCASYTLMSTNRPAIYEYKDFAPRVLHSSSPSFGSLVKTIETPEQIVRSGLTEVTVYDAGSYSWKKVPLSSRLVYRLFPRIPSFASLSSSERCQLYRIGLFCVDMSPVVRRIYLRHLMSVNSFFNDYITFGARLLPDDVIDSKLDRFYYAVKRLHFQCNVFGLSYREYDSFIDQFFVNVYCKLLKFQFDYEKSIPPTFSLEVVLPAIDIALPGNVRSLSSVEPGRYSEVSPWSLDSDYFRSMDNMYKCLIKRKCDNAYLELHPEYKQFHSNSILNYGTT